MILKNGKDYYDFVMSYGHDDSHTFYRDNREVYKPFLYEPDSEFDRLSEILFCRLAYSGDLKYRSNSTKTNTLFSKHCSVMVCGKVYYGYEFIEVHSDNKYESHVFWDFDAFHKFMKARDIPYTPGTKKTFIHGYELSRMSLEFCRNNGIVAACTKPFPSKIAPRHFTYKDYDTIIINPYCLEKLHFYKALDAFSIFQEIEMFLGSITSQNENINHDIPDQYRFEKHGFDTWSFRKKPVK